MACHQNNQDRTAPPPGRASNYKRLLDYYRADAAGEDGAPAPSGRFALAMIESREAISDNLLACADSFTDACLLAGEEVLDSGRMPDAVYDLDTGERIELHTTTPTVTRSEDQGIMVNPLAGE